jgi:hypothetical protein
MTMGRSRSKIYALVLAFAALVVVSLAPRRAHACGGGGMGSPALWGTVLLVGGGVAVTDVVFTGYDLVQGVSEERASKGMAIAEVAVTAPQVAIGTYVLMNSTRSNDMAVPAIYTAWTGTLLAHGIVTLVTMPKDPFAPAEPARSPTRPLEHEPNLSVAPAMLSDGMRSAGIPGLSAVGRF